MRRREFIATLGAGLAWPLVARGQQRNIKRLAVFSPSEPSAFMHERSENRYYTALFKELRRLGWVEGQNLTVEGYGREQNTSGSPDVLAMDIVRSNPDVIYTVGPGAVSFKPATSRIPIVALTADPVALGIAQSLAHPGGNFTGVTIDAGPSIHGNGLRCCARCSRRCRKWAVSLFVSNGMDQPQSQAPRSAQQRKQRAFLLLWL